MSWAPCECVHVCTCVCVHVLECMCVCLSVFVLACVNACIVLICICIGSQTLHGQLGVAVFAKGTKRKLSAGLMGKWTDWQDASHHL